MTRGIDQCLAEHGLSVVGAFQVEDGDGTPDGVQTLCLIGARDGAMWRAFSASPEAGDGTANPLDRWSVRVIGAAALKLGALALFPFGGPPYQPFQRWAARGEAAVPSPVGMQATPERGLWTSYRGALGFRQPVSVVTPQGNACLDCPAPCLSACPVDAFANGTYDVPRCVAHVTGPAGAVCREGGCQVRHACPAGREATPPAAQCQFHMDAFIAARRVARRDDLAD